MVVLDAVRAGSETRFSAGGSCANVMAVLAYLGWEARAAARLGDDPEGRRVVEDMESCGAGADLLELEPGSATPRIVELVGGAGHRFRFECDHGRALPRRRPLRPGSARAALERLAGARVFYFDRAEPEALEMARALKSRGAAVFFEPPRFLDTEIFARCLEISDVVKCCRARRAPGAPAAPLEVLTMGAGGLDYREGGGWRHLDPVRAPGLVDAAGSGDWLSAGFIHRRFGPDGLGTEAALRFGQALASVNCGFAGARGAMHAAPRKELLSAAASMQAGGPGLGRPERPAPPTRAESECRVCRCGHA